MCFGIFRMVSQIFIHPIFAIRRRRHSYAMGIWPGRQGRQLQSVGGHCLNICGSSKKLSRHKSVGPGLLSPSPPASFCPLLGKLKWKKSCTGFRSKPDLPGHSSRLHARPQAQQVQAALWIRKWVLEFLSPWRSGQSSKRSKTSAKLPRWSKQHCKSWDNQRWISEHKLMSAVWTLGL